MIQANELRIGNWVYYEKDKCNVKISIGDFLYKENEYFAPIPLTEEWLLRFGFDRELSLCDFSILLDENLDTKLMIDLHDAVATTSIYDCDEITITYIQDTLSVHQLQNLYFALTGEELTMKN